jgi:hypothetical protein
MTRKEVKATNGPSKNQKLHINLPLEVKLKRIVRIRQINRRRRRRKEISGLKYR